MRIPELKRDAEDVNWIGNDFERRIMEDLYKAYREARKGKRKTVDVQRFEANLDANLGILCEQIRGYQYTPSPGTAHIIHRPVIREIFAAPFQDRVVHHLIYDKVYPYLDTRFIYDSYSCREGKGTLFGIERLAYHIRSVSRNGARKAYIVKMDIKGYFMSLPRKELCKRALWWLERQYAGGLKTCEYKMLKFLWTQVIMDEPVTGVKRKGRLSDWDDVPPEKSLFCQEPGIGIVIGNLTSQLLSNIYLDMLDRFVVYDLSYKHYGRYVDDFYIVVTEEELPQVMRDVEAIRLFLLTKGLTLHPKKMMVATPEMGVPFLGAMVHGDYILPGERLKQNFRRACVEVQAGARDIETFVSYLGHVEHFDKIRFLSKTLEEVIGMEYRI